METGRSRAGLVGSPVAWGKNAGNAMVARNGVLNSLIALSPIAGQLRGLSPLMIDWIALSSVSSRTGNGKKEWLSVLCVESELSSFCLEILLSLWFGSSSTTRRSGGTASSESHCKALWSIDVTVTDVLLFEPVECR